MSEESGVGPVLLSVIEALLFVTDRPLSVQDICAALQNETLEPEVVEAALGLLEDRHSEGAAAGRGFQLVHLGEGWQFRTVREATPWLAEFTGLRPVRLSRAALETLAVVAYRQPCTRADIERVRGVDSGGVVRALLDRRLVRLAGRRNEPGRPNLYATTQEFLDVFGLSSIKEMPNLREFTMLGEEDMEAVTAIFGEEEENQVTMEEFANRKALEAGQGPTPGLEPLPGESAELFDSTAPASGEDSVASDVVADELPAEPDPAATAEETPEEPSDTDSTPDPSGASE